jgi:hypothetical protein
MLLCSLVESVARKVFEDILKIAIDCNREVFG